MRYYWYILYIYTYILYKYISTFILHHIASEFYIYIICSMFVPSNLDVLCTYLEDLLEVFLPICTNHPPIKSPESLAMSLCSLYIIPVYQIISVYRYIIISSLVDVGGVSTPVKQNKQMLSQIVSKICRAGK